MQLGSLQMLVLVVCAFLGGFTKTGIVGLGIVITPLLASVFPSGAALGILLPLFLGGDIISVTRFNHKAPWRVVLVSVPWGIAGIVLGWVAAGFIQARFGVAADRILKVSIGILMGCSVAAGMYLFKQSGRGAGVVGGPPRLGVGYTAALCTFSGFAAMLTNSGGPIWAVYFSSLGLDVRQVIAAGVWGLFLCNLVKMPFSANLGFFTTEYLLVNVALLPVTVLGLFMGSKVAGRYSRETFARILQVLTACGAGYMIFS